MLLDAHRTLKIADFGVARVEAQNPRDMTGETGTLGYMAPEVLMHSLVTDELNQFYNEELHGSNGQIILLDIKICSKNMSIAETWNHNTQKGLK